MQSEILERARERNPNQPEFIQAAEEILSSVALVLEKKSEYRRLKIFDRLLEPERLISFRVTWLDDKEEVQVNRGYRVQMNSAIGPYKGGLRFHPTVNPSVLKFLALEQTLKNALTGLPMGGGKGGSDFDPKGKSDYEVMKFCQAFMIELERHIGHRLDVPAGDIGVGGREIGYLFGYYKKIKNEFTGVLTGKGIGWGGSLMRTEATGYGLIYFAENMLNTKGDTIRGKTCLVSGSGNVALHAIEKINKMGGKVITASDSGGFIFDESGITKEKLEYLKDLKFNRRGRIDEYVEKYKEASFQPTSEDDAHNPLWDIKADCAFPCATQNEVNEKDASNLVRNNVRLLCEGANMPTSLDAIKTLKEGGVMFAPGKASNAGGVATSGLEMAQNFMGQRWTREEVDSKLQEIMKTIHDNCLHVANEYGLAGSYLDGANIAGFLTVADAMKAQGTI